MKSAPFFCNYNTTKTAKIQVLYMYGQDAIISWITVHFVHSSLRKSMKNSLRERGLLTPESLSYGLRSKCADL